MLETVREFGRMQLVGAGEDDAAHAAQLAWARRTPSHTPPTCGRRGQVAAVRAIAAEENNLADCAPRGGGVPDPVDDRAS